MEQHIKHAQHIHLTGFKGVAMASIAQCFHDMGKTLSGSDVAEKFVTETVLQQTGIQPYVSFASEHVPSYTELLIYTSAHNGPNNPEVVWAKSQNIPVLSQAEALAELFNQKKGIAVCGVGGKSTTSAMITWIFSQLHIPVSFSVGVGRIAGLSKTGQWDPQSEYFIAEADEYVTDPSAAQRGETITPRFSFLHPNIIVCTYLAFDHPDVYKDYEHTKQTFLDFFRNLKQNGTLIINGDQPELVQLADELKTTRSDVTVLTFGEQDKNSLQVHPLQYVDGQVESSITLTQKDLPVILSVPGKHNLINACAALLACTQSDIDISQAIESLLSFHSTQRRFEYKGIHDGVKYYDDYAHHPRELKIVIQTLKEMFPKSPIYVIFQPHTFSRTKALLSEFIEVLAQAPHLILMDIFASARENFDDSITSKMLVDQIKAVSPNSDIRYIPSIAEVADFCTHDLPRESVCITLGAGDIYQVHDKIAE